MKRLNKVLSIFLVLAIIMPGIVQAETPSGIQDVKRIYGNNRYETAIKASEEVYNKADTVLLASGENYADALAGSALSAKEDAPILLTRAKKLDADTLNKIKSLGAKEVIILGGEVAVSSAVEKEVKKIANVKRIYGDNRYRTAELIAKEVGTSDEAFVVSGNNFADALAAGAASAKLKAPILLSNRDKIDNQTISTLKNINAKKVYVVGGEIAVPKKVENEIKKVTDTKRISGSNRYTTSLEVAKYFFKNLDAVLLASGRSFSDALVGGYIGAKQNAPIMLTDTNKIDNDVLDYVKGSNVKVSVLGGEVVVNSSIINKIIGKDIVTGDLKVHFLDVGQGDSTLIEVPNGEFILIDGGTRSGGTKVINYLNKKGIKKLDYVIGTHPHEDHIGGLVEIINQFNIGEIYLPDKTHTTKVFEDLLMAISNKGKKFTTVEYGDMILNKDGINMNVLAPSKNSSGTNLNNYSIVNKLTYENTSFLFTGDAEAQTEDFLITSGANLRADVLKVGHHGGNTSSSTAFLNKVKPKHSIISCGLDNQYGHPHLDVLQRLNNIGSKVYRTDKSGDIIVTSNGDKITIDTKAEPLPKPEPEPEPEPEEPIGNEIFATKTGTKYHRDGCRYLSSSKIPITLKEARNRGLEPCGVCKP